MVTMLMARLYHSQRLLDCDPAISHPLRRPVMPKLSMVKYDNIITPSANTSVLFVQIASLRISIIV